MMQCFSGFAPAIHQQRALQRVAAGSTCETPMRCTSGLCTDMLEMFW